MILELEQKEQLVAAKLINDGLSCASGTLTSLLKTPISINKVDFGAESIQKSPRLNSTNKNGQLHVLRTALIGELQGVCHLIFTQDEIEKINQVCLPPGLQNGSEEQKKVLRDGFLTELDNIVSAAVVTQFSNYLDVDLFGHVPSVDVMPQNEMKSYLEKEAAEFGNVVYFKANFEGKELDISPDFTWMFQDQFLDKIKSTL